MKISYGRRVGKETSVIGAEWEEQENKFRRVQRQGTLLYHKGSRTNVRFWPYLEMKYEGIDRWKEYLNERVALQITFLL